MIELNLLPSDLKTIQKQKKTSLKIKIPKIAPIPFIVGAISFLLVSQAAFGLLAIAQRRRLLRVSKELAGTSSQEQVAATLKNEADELNRKFSVIASLTSGSLIWSEKLSRLSDAITDGVWLTSLSLQSELPKGSTAITTVQYGKPAAAAGPRQTLVLQGSAASSTSGEETAIVGRFIESLRNNKDLFKDFDDIKLSSIERRKLGDIEVMDFIIICYFKPDRSYFEKLEAGNI